MAGKSDTDSLVLNKTNTEIKPPDMYRVVLLNDHYTPMDFVVDVLRTVFHKNPVEATKIMLEVHKKGRGLAGVYIHDIAATKVQQVEGLAKIEEYPLKCTMERT
ncbi:MAG: ATP-dependent Clp protease adapter ClpS [Spirochaetales bacterium]|uniref:ATP-dependent Clp protease adapter protein ClpS n=1 Tax=Candidatus Thalassospirochaeta sargassi TaxID=3119039 RepID=A0AAJ1MIB2_9SPIO|nr:ATP-dependent Clp protease adapter ClpS [Spirochaetales bacterium]